MSPLLSIVVPSACERPGSFESALRSIEPDPRLQVIVVANTNRQYAAGDHRRIFRRASAHLPGDWRFYELPSLGAWGHPAANWALDHAVEAPVVARIDDDDVYLPGATGLMLDAALDGRVHVFRARWGSGHPACGVELWHSPVVVMGNVATPMLVAPVCGARYGQAYTGDYDYACELERRCGEWVWRQELICEVRPAPPERLAA